MARSDMSTSSGAQSSLYRLMISQRVICSRYMTRLSAGWLKGMISPFRKELLCAFEISDIQPRHCWAMGVNMQIGGLSVSLQADKARSDSSFCQIVGAVYLWLPLHQGIASLVCHHSDRRLGSPSSASAECRTRIWKVK